MKILLLNYEYPPLGGGAGVVSQHLVNEFIKLGHSVTVITTWFSGEDENYSDNNLTIIRLKSKRKRTYQSNPIEMASWMFKTIQYCKNNEWIKNHDICLTNFTLPGGWVGYKLKQWYKIPYVILSHGHDIPWFSPKQMFLWHILFYFPIKILMKFANYNILLTKALKINADKFIGNKYAFKNIVIANGLYPFQFRNGFNASDKIINALFVGRLVDQKDPLTTIKVFELLQKENFPIVLKFIGDGELKQDLENYITKNNIKNIYLVGQISQSSVMKEYEQAHILIAPSREEAMSLTILEAVSSGVYIFATKVSGNTELILDNINGNFVEFGNPKNIADKIKSFYRDKFLKNYQYPEIMLKYIQQNYTWESTALKYITVFEKAILNHK